MAEMMVIIALLIFERIISQILFWKERKELYSRLQAGTLNDYTIQSIRNNSKKNPEVLTNSIAKLDNITDDGNIYDFPEDDTVNDMSSARISFDKLMG